MTRILHIQLSCKGPYGLPRLVSTCFLMVCAALLLVLASVPAFAQAQKSTAQAINFQDLQRPGRDAIKVYPITGLKQEADRWFSSFSDIDSSERSEIASAMASHDSARSNCKQGGDCYRVEETKRDRVVVRCTAGMKKGETQWISVSNRGEYDCGGLFFTTCEKSLHKVALRACMLD